MTPQDKYLEMTTRPVKGLVCRMALPTIVAMLTTSLYNVADAAFVGHVSTGGTAGVGIALAYMAFVQALGFFFGHGSGNYISRALGAREDQSAQVVASVGVFSSLFLGTLTAVLCLPNLDRLSILLGAPAEVVPYASDYLRYIVLATPFMMAALTLNNQLRLQGNARFAMVGIVSGALLNIGLDPLFIFVLGMGVSGASLATAVSQAVAFTVLFVATTRPSCVHISLRNFRPSMKIYDEILRGGLPSLCRQTFNCAAALALNHCAVHYAAPGQEASAVAAFAIVTRVMMLAFSIVLGFCQGFQPVCGFNYGAGQYQRVRHSWHFTMIVGTLFLLVISVVGYLFAPQIIALFRAEDLALIEIGTATLRWQCIAFPLVASFTATGMLLQNIRYTASATLLSVSRNGLFFIPAIIMLPTWLGLQGVQMAQAVADVFTFIMALPIMVWIDRRLRHKMSAAAQ